MLTLIAIAFAKKLTEILIEIKLPGFANPVLKTRSPFLV